MSRFRRRLMGLAAMKRAFADDFVRCECIENVSNAYIDTLYKPNNNTKVEIRGTVSSNGQYIFGARTAAYNRAFGFYGADTTNKARWDYDNKLVNGDFALSVNEIYKISNNKNVITVYNESTDISNSITAANNTFTCQYTMYYFGINQKNVLAAMTKGKLYYLKIWENDVLVRDYIPMYQISTDTYGLWDRVTKEFYTSPNGVKFTGGARVVEDANGKLYYIKNYISFAGGGKSLVSIGLKPNETDYYETKWYFAGSGRSNFMGARTKTNNNDYQCYGYSKALHITYDTGNIVNYSVTYTNKAYIFKTYFNKKTNQMYGAIYDENKQILAHNKVAKRSGTASVAFFIGKQNGFNNYYPPVNSRMYYFKYWRNHELVRDMIPVQSVETGEYGFFDKVNLKIYYSSGSADFTGA